ncbi:uncharacterized protein LOC143424159 isoform X2 [Xylocopa sonorina]
MRKVHWYRCDAGAWSMTWAELLRGLQRGGTKKTRREKMRPRVQRSLKDGHRGNSSLSRLMRLVRNV